MDEELNTKFPGTEIHQKLLATITDYYAQDERILAILCFGSLGRGNWDAYSDLDLDIVIQNGIPFDVPHELGQLCKAIKHEHGTDAIIIADAEEGDVVLSNLMEFSIRYHPLADTKPAILDSMILLAGTFSIDQIRTAGENRRHLTGPDLNRLVDQGVRYIVGLHKALQRERVWMALEVQHRIRSLIMQIFTVTHGGDRALQFFEQNADQKLQDKLKTTFPEPHITGLNQALYEMIALMEYDLSSFSGNQCRLNKQQQKILLTIKTQKNWISGYDT
jgi:predicted nucleotidyltransferase